MEREEDEREEDEREEDEREDDEREKDDERGREIEVEVNVELRMEDGNEDEDEGYGIVVVEKRRVVEVDSRVEVAGVEVVDLNVDETHDDKTHDDELPDAEDPALTLVDPPVSTAEEGEKEEKEEEEEEEEEVTKLAISLLEVCTGVRVQIPVELPPPFKPPEGKPEDKSVVQLVDMGIVEGKGVEVPDPLSITVIHCVLVRLSVMVMMLVGRAGESVRDVLLMMRVAERVGERGVDVDVDVEVSIVMGLAERIGFVTVEIVIETVVERPPLPEIKAFVAEAPIMEELESTDVESKVPETVVPLPVSSATRCGCVNGKSDRIDVFESSSSSSSSLSSSSSPPCSCPCPCPPFPESELHGQPHRFS
ncbi:hypothetical protein ACHAO1_005017 [Botrytis cinerea]